MTSNQKENNQEGKKFFVNIEGTEYPWDKNTITISEIRQLGSIPSDQQIVVENPDGSEQQLTDSAVIEIMPGHRFGRAPKYKRG